MSAQSVEGEFKVVTGAVTICACDHSPKGVAPSAHLGDGQVRTLLTKSAD
jgi:hypothetical protein